MNLNRKTAIVVGVLFIIATVAGVLSVISYGDVLDAPADLALVSANENQVLIGSIFYFIMAVAIPAIAIVIYPILKKSGEAVALGYVGARIGEGFFFVVQIITTLTLFSLSREYIGAGGVEASHLQSLGTLLLSAGNWASLFGFGFFFTLSALILNFVLYRTKLVPRWLSGWGLIGAGLIWIFYLIQYFNHNQVQILFLPIASQEMIFALWLIVKGFNSSAIDSESVITDTNEIK
jgi:hypothetical protein